MLLFQLQDLNQQFLTKKRKKKKKKEDLNQLKHSSLTEELVGGYWLQRPWTPFKQLFTGMNNHFYEAEAVLLLPISCFNCFNKLLFTTTQCQMTSHVTIQTLTRPNLWALFKTHAELCCPALSLTIVECIHQPCPSVVPVFDHIVWPIMDFNFHGVSTIVYWEDDALLPTL